MLTTLCRDIENELFPTVVTVYTVHQFSIFPLTVGKSSVDKSIPALRLVQTNPSAHLENVCSL